jgi:hypothetical protein
MCKRLLMLFALLAASAAAGPASAVVCYTLLDKGDQVIYRGYDVPVDMSAAGQPAREAMRRRGEYMIVSYVDNCLLVAASRWTTGKFGPASVDEIVADMRPFAAGAPSGTPTSVGGATSPLPPARPTAPAPAVRSGSSGMRSGY